MTFDCKEGVTAPHTIAKTQPNPNPPAPKTSTRGYATATASFKKEAPRNGNKTEHIRHSCTARNSDGRHDPSLSTPKKSDNPESEQNPWQHAELSSTTVTSILDHAHSSDKLASREFFAVLLN